MKIETMPKETLAELLLFLADHEEFTKVEELLNEAVTVAQAKAALREVAMGLMKEAAEEAASPYNALKDSALSKEAKTIISYLSPGEEKSLLSAFGLIEKSKPISKTAS